MKKNIIFDFDGVILNSHKVKTDAFYKLFLKHGKTVAMKSKNFHLKNIGKNRYYKFKYIYNNYIKKKLNNNTIEKLDLSFDQFVSKKISYLKPSKHLIHLLKTKKKYNFYISTSTPQDKIIDILKKKKILKYFKKIYGSPKKKTDHIRLITKNKNKTLFIGDSAQDYIAAKKTKIAFLLKNNSENKQFRHKNIKTLRINSFKNFDQIISKII